MSVTAKAPNEPIDSTSIHARPTRTRFFQWRPTDDDQVRQVEERLLAGLEYKQRFIAGINTISSVGSEKKHHTVVLLHGFAGGLGCWAQNWTFLSAHYDVHAIDLPGFGRSVRSTRSFRDQGDAMEYYVDNLSAWFSAVGIPKHHTVSVVGHSFGGYIAANMVVRMLQRKRREEGEEDIVAAEEAKEGAAYPNIVHLVLADPWGVPPKKKRELPLKFRLLLKVFYNASPLAIVRCAGPWGPNLLPRVRPDFAERWGHLPDPLIFYDYTYHCNAQTPPTGELAFQACCEGAAFAKVPLLSYLPDALRRLCGLSPTPIDGAPAPPVMGGDKAPTNTIARSKPIPALPNISIFYGDHTWMDVDAGRSLFEKLSLDGIAGRVTLEFVHNAGHQLNTDNAPHFNDLLRGAIDHILMRH